VGWGYNGNLDGYGYPETKQGVDSGVAAVRDGGWLWKKD